MAEEDPNTPQAVDPETATNLVRLLQIRGPLGVLNVLDTIIPVVNMGDVVARTVAVLQPSFRSTDVFSAGKQVGAPAATVHADTGPLAEGIYDVLLQIPETTNTSIVWDVEHRDAANAANLAVWSTIISGTTGGRFKQRFAYEFAANERLRILNEGGVAAGVTSVAFIFARRRT